MVGMTSDDCNKLQLIQNSSNILLTGAMRVDPTTELLKMTVMVSIMQMVAYTTLSMVQVWQARIYRQESQLKWKEEQCSKKAQK